MIMMLERLPVADAISQGWLANATEGVIPRENGSTVEQLVYAYGNYQRWGHDGIDFACRPGTLIYAPGPGRVDYAGPSHLMPQWVADKYAFIKGDTSGGNVVLIDHGGLGTAYLHLERVNVATGAWVATSTVLGVAGSTGRSGGVHLHWSAIILPIDYQDRLYSRINPLTRIPAGILVPLGAGGTGAGTTTRRTLLGLPGLPITGE